MSLIEKVSAVLMADTLIYVENINIM